MSVTHENAGLAVGVEVSTNWLTAICLDETWRLSGELRKELVYSETASSQLIRFIQELKSAFGHFNAVGIAIPGLIAKDGKSVAFSSHIAEFSGLELAALINTETGAHAFLENDANAAAYGEYQLGAGRGTQNIFYVTLGAGVGGALIFDGEIWRGAAGFAGEFGYIPINSDGVRIEEVASSINIIRRTRSRIHQDNTSSLIDLDENALTIKDIVQAAEAEDDFSKLMLERTGEYVGVGVANVINLLNIEKIVIGGEIMGGKASILTSIVARARELSFGPSFNSTVIVAGELGQNAGAVGAALLSANLN